MNEQEPEAISLGVVHGREGVEGYAMGFNWWVPSDAVYKMPSAAPPNYPAEVAVPLLTRYKYMDHTDAFFHALIFDWGESAPLSPEKKLEKFVVHAAKVAKHFDVDTDDLKLFQREPKNIYLPRPSGSVFEICNLAEHVLQRRLPK